MLPVVWAIKTAAHDGISTLTLAAVALGIAAGVWFVRRQNRSATPILDMR
jgi:DHA2 family multidrug resistance protein-like MFS transporter